MRIARFLFLPLWSAAALSAQPQFGGSAIFKHDALTCMSTDDFPVVEAELDPAELGALRQAQVYFRASRTEAWYFVDMEPAEGSRLRATLPKPLAEIDHVDYYLFFLSSSFEPAQSREFSARVTKNGCEGIPTVASPSSVSLVLRATVANQPPVPVGFSSEGISSLVTAAGNTVTVGSAAAGGGTASGGLSAAAIGAVAGGGAAAAAVVVVASGKKEDGGATSPDASPSPQGGSMPTSSSSGSSSTSSGGSSPSPSPSPSPAPTPSIPDVAGTWQVTDRITESCFPGSVGQSSTSTMVIQQDGTHLTVTLGDANFSANLTGTIDSTGKISMSGQFNDEGEPGNVVVDATTKTGSDMTGSYSQFYTNHNCNVRGTFSGSKR